MRGNEFVWYTWSVIRDTVLLGQDLLCYRKQLCTNWLQLLFLWTCGRVHLWGDTWDLCSVLEFTSRNLRKEDFKPRRHLWYSELTPAFSRLREQASSVSSASLTPKALTSSCPFLQCLGMGQVTYTWSIYVTSCPVLLCDLMLGSLWLMSIDWCGVSLENLTVWATSSWAWS